MRWLRGHFAANTWGGLWSWERLPSTLDAAVSTCVAPVGTPIQRLIRNSVFGSVLAVALLGAWRWERLGLGAPLPVLLLALMVHGISIFWWDPANPKFWLLAWVPVLFLLGEGYAALEGWLSQVWVSVARGVRTTSTVRAFRVACRLVTWAVPVALLGCNVVWGHLPRHRETEVFAQALNQWIAHSQPGDVLVTGGDLVAPLTFWAGRPSVLDLTRLAQRAEDLGNPALLDPIRAQIVDALSSGKRVLVAPDAAGRLPAFLSHCDTLRAFTYVNQLTGRETPVYQILPARPSVAPLPLTAQR